MTSSSLDMSLLISYSVVKNIPHEHWTLRVYASIYGSAVFDIIDFSL